MNRQSSKKWGGSPDGRNLERQGIACPRNAQKQNKGEKGKQRDLLWIHERGASAMSNVKFG